MKTSVVVCTYNGARFIEEQIYSILNQTLEIDEIIICDDGSTDETVDKLMNFEKRFNQIRVFTSSTRLGTIKNFEKALSYTTGNYIFLSDQDDIWLPSKVKHTLNFFELHKDIKCVFTDAYLINENNNFLNSYLWDKWGFNNKFKQRWINNDLAFKDLLSNINKITGATICFKRELLRDILPINIPLGFWHDAWIGLHAAGKKSLGFIDEPLIEYRIHTGQQVGIMKTIDSNIILKSNPRAVSLGNFKRNLFKKYPHLLIKFKTEKVFVRLQKKINRVYLFLFPKLKNE